MNTATPPVPPHCFTLGSALRWLGYDDQGRHCPPPIDVLPASVWFLRRGGQQVPHFPLQTFLLLDLTDTAVPVAFIQERVEDINRTTGSDVTVFSHDCEMACRVTDSAAPVALHPHDPATGHRAALGPTPVPASYRIHLPYPRSQPPASPVADFRRFSRT